MEEVQRFSIHVLKKSWIEKAEAFSTKRDIRVRMYINHIPTL